MVVVSPAELERLRTLRDYGILDTDPDPRFDRITALAWDHFQVPYALVSLVDENRVWFKSNCGFPVNEIAGKEDTFCAQAIFDDKVLIIPDTKRDPRFANSPIVAGPPYVRFYAGAPLIVRPGIRLGTLCIMDVKPRSFSGDQAVQLRDLAEMVVDQLNLHRSQQRLKGETERRRVDEEEIKRQQSELWRQGRLLTHVSRLAHIGGWEYEVATDKLSWSEEVYRIHDVPDNYEPTQESALSFYPEDIREKVRNAIDQSAQTGTPFEFELPLLTAKGRRRWVRVIGEVQREGGEVARVFGTLQDVTERRRAQERIAFLASHDPLTKLPNRAVFQEALEKATAPPDGAEEHFALLLIGLDHFKDINDTLGHYAGDALMREFADRVTSVSGKRDLAARLGGDEFALILRDVASRDDVAARAEYLQGKLSQVFSYDGRPLAISASIGIALSPKDGTEPDVLHRNASMALHAAKTHGGGYCVFYDHSMRINLERERYTLAAIRHALDRGELVPYYQPIISLRNGALIAFEALARWVKAEGLVAGPATFQAALDDPNLSEQIGTCMIQSVAKQIAAWEKQGHNRFRVAVNIAAGQFRGGRLAATILEELRSYGVAPTRLAVEVTETVLMSRHSEEVADILHELHSHGVHIALDDFGTGYASLSHLRDFPSDTIKIDRSFVQSMMTSNVNASIVEGIINLSHRLGKRTTAEGIETVEAAKRLRKLGCNRGQGFLLGRAMPPEKAEAYIVHLGRRSVKPRPAIKAMKNVS